MGAWWNRRRFAAAWIVVVAIALVGATGGYSLPFAACAALFLVPEISGGVRHFTLGVFLVAILLAFVSVLVLYFWVISRSVFSFAPFPRAVVESGWLFFLAITGISIVNAVQEEVVWRLIAPRLIGGPPALGVVVSSIGFGISHWYGIPDGVFGVLATTAFGFAMHWLVRLGRGTLFWACLVHAVADFAALFFLYGQGGFNG